MTTTRRPTFRQVLARAAFAPAFLFALVCTFYVPSAVMNDGATHVTHHAGALPGDPTTKGSPAALIADHGCWTGPTPKDMAGKVPGHVIVATTDAPVYAGPKMAGLALDQLFNGHDHGLHVYAFCR